MYGVVDVDIYSDAETNYENNKYTDTVQIETSILIPIEGQLLTVMNTQTRTASQTYLLWSVLT